MKLKKELKEKWKMNINMEKNMKNKNNKDCVMKIRVPNKLLKKLKNYAEEDYTTMTEIIRRGIIREIKNWENRK